jgi:serine/threonine protein kinase/Tol biopolymer transport system component
MSGTDPLIGQTISHYRIIEKLGDGGMGVVYKAEDSRLGRCVALKFLPPGVERDANALARFHHEAQAASSLNHPNICTIHDIGEQDGQSFIAMELLEGQTLKARIGSRALPLKTFLDWALQISDALDAAHKRGIVHRDVKPANIFVTTRDEIKLADFGLAKRLPLEPSGPEDPPTISGALTVQGQIVGTLAYMSPEQMQNMDIDARSDIFSFGAVMYEMSTGRPAFNGTSPAILIAEIVRGESKPVRDINPAAPEELQRIIGKSLEKDPADRYQTANDLMVDLRRLKRAQLGASETSLKTKALPLRFPWLRAISFWIMGIGTAALLTFMIVALTTPAPDSGPLESQQITFSNEIKNLPIVTDGSRLYFQSNGKTVEMSVKGGPVAPLRASLSGMKILDISPDASELLAWKPNLNDETNRGSLWTVPVLGGTPNRLGNQLARGASWSPDGRSIVYADLNSVLVSDNNGANVKQIWDAHRMVAGWPRFSPDSKRIRVTVAGASPADPTRIWEVDVDGGHPHQLALAWPDDAYQRDGQWTADGRHFFFSSNREDLSGIYELKQPPWFELWKKPTTVRLTAGQIDVLGATPSRDSTGLFVMGRIAQGAMQAYDSRQNRFMPYLGGLPASALIVSPDRKWMVYSDYPRHFLWRSRLDGSEKLQLTGVYSWMPQWSPDSKSIAFSNQKEIYRVSVDGGAPEKLTSEGKAEVAPSWSPDGKSIAFNDFPSPGRVDGLKVVDLATRKVSIMPGSEGFYVPSWSPDGLHMVAMAENPSRMVLYSARNHTWKELKKFEAVWGFWVWSSDSKSLNIAMTQAAPGEDPGIYRLTIVDGTWERIAKFDGVTVSSEGSEGFPCITPNGQLAIMSDTSAIQIYFAKWNTSADPP